jgi:tRNA 2-thiouridine synthesizing protein A
MEREVDLTAEICPMTFVKAKVHLDQVAVGETLWFVLLAGEQVRNVPRSLKDEGHKIESASRDGDRFRLLVRKGA